MNGVIKRRGGLLIGLMTVLLLWGWCVQVQAVVNGITGTTTFNLVAKQDYISTPDPDSILMWGYANGANRMQYPGPTLIVKFSTVASVSTRPISSDPVMALYPP